MSRVLEYSVLDVFAERALEGNPLAVFHDGRGLSDELLQSIARETNLSETTFIIPGDPDVERVAGVRVRIFTVAEELLFAGHPTLGTASWLHWHHPSLRGAEAIALDLKVGRLPVRFRPNEAGDAGVFGTMRQKDPEFGKVHDPQAIAAALGLSIEDLDPDLPIQTVSTGMAFCIVPLRSLEVAGRLEIPRAEAQRYLDRSDAKFFHCIARTQPGSKAQWHARMQFYNGEDPATGSASGCTIAYLVRHGLVASGEPVVLEQGVEMLRPSRIEVSAQIEADAVVKVEVGGRTIPVAEGRLFLP